MMQGNRDVPHTTVITPLLPGLPITRTLSVGAHP